MEELMTIVNGLEGADISQIRISDGQMMIAAIVSIVVAAILCFFGLKLKRVLAALTGFAMGAVIGGVVAGIAGLSGMAFVGAILGCAAVVAILMGIFYKPGIFFWSFSSVVFLAGSFLDISQMLFAMICLALGLIAAIVTMFVFEPFVIIISGLSGAITIGVNAVTLLGMDDNLIVRLIITLLFAVLGIVVQFMMRSREIGKKEKDYAEEFRATTSMEAEVERARRLLDDDDDE